MFVDTDRGAVAVSKIIRYITPRGSKDTVIYFEGKNGVEEATLLSYEKEALRSYGDGATIIPAQPGTYRLWDWIEDDGSHRSNRMSVIAWRILNDESAVPTIVTTDGANDGSDVPPPILFPDGSVVIQGEHQFGSIEDWLAWSEPKARDRRAAEDARKAENAAAIAAREKE